MRSHVPAQTEEAGMRCASRGVGLGSLVMDSPAGRVAFEFPTSFVCLRRPSAPSQHKSGLAASGGPVRPKIRFRSHGVHRDNEERQ